jgi:hypothetical protein
MQFKKKSNQLFSSKHVPARKRGLFPRIVKTFCLSVHLFPLFLSYFHVIRVLRFGLLLRALHEEQTVVVIVAVVEQVQHKREEKRI